MSAVLVIFGLAWFVGSASVSAHNRDKTSEPENNAVLDVAPQRVTFWFKSPVGTDAATIFLIDPSGARTKMPLLKTSKFEVAAELPSLPNGAYTVRWKLISTDGHPVTNKIRFTVAVPGQRDFDSSANQLNTAADRTAIATAPSQTELEPVASSVSTPASNPVPSPVPSAVETSAPQPTTPSQSTPVVEGEPVSSPVPVGTAGPQIPERDVDVVGGAPNWVRWFLRFASYVSIFAAVGALLAAQLVWPAFRKRRSFRRMVFGGLAACAALAVVQLGVLAADIGSGGFLSSLWKTRTFDAGAGFGARAVLSVMAAAVVARSGLPKKGGKSFAMISLIGAALFATWAYVGHAKSQRWPLVGIPLDVVHHGAAAAWLVCLGVVGFLGLTKGNPKSRGLTMRRLSMVSTRSVALIVSTGLVQSVRLVGGVDGFLNDGHSRLLVLKVLLVAAMLLFAVRNRRITETFRDQSAVPSISLLRRRLMAEFAIGVLVIALTASLVVRPPASTEPSASTLPPIPTNSKGFLQ